jgi:hypothetical protein
VGLDSTSQFTDVPSIRLMSPHPWFPQTEPKAPLSPVRGFILTAHLLDG